jgi:hypothetical protein
MKKLLTLIIIFLCFNCKGQTYSQSNFSFYPTPLVNSDARYKLDTMKESFSVSIVGGQLRIGKNTMLSGKEYALTTGKLLLLDLGELGGGLYYKPNDTSKKIFFVNGKPENVNNQLENYDWILKKSPTKNLIKGNFLLIAGGNTQAIVPYKNDWLFIQGMQIGTKHGRLSQLTIKKDSFIVSKIFNFEAIPTAMYIYKDKFFIITNNAFYSIEGGKEELVLNNLFWEGLYPNSIAVINESYIYVGMRGGYAQIDLTKKYMKFYKYNN